MATPTNSEQLRAAVIAFVQSLLPFLVLVGIISWTSDTIAACMLVVTNATTLGFLLYPNKKAAEAPVAAPAPVEPTSGP